MLGSTCQHLLYRPTSRRDVPSRVTTNLPIPVHRSPPAFTIRSRVREPPFCGCFSPPLQCGLLPACRSTPGSTDCAYRCCPAHLLACQPGFRLPRTPPPTYLFTYPASASTRVHYNITCPTVAWTTTHGATDYCHTPLAACRAPYPTLPAAIAISTPTRAEGDALLSTRAHYGHAALHAFACAVATVTALPPNILHVYYLPCNTVPLFAHYLVPALQFPCPSYAYLPVYTTHCHPASPPHCHTYYTVPLPIPSCAPPHAHTASLPPPYHYPPAAFITHL